MLARYLTDTARLLRDRTSIITPQTELIDYVNQSRRLVARITGCIRCLVAGQAPWGGGATPGLAVPGAATPGIADTSIISFQTLPGVEKYHFRYADPFLQAQYAGVEHVIDLFTVAVTWNTAARPVMEWYSWDELQALARIYSAGVFTFPFCAAKQGDGINQMLYLFPVPGQALEMEWDAVCTPKRIYQDSDYDVIPDPFQEAVKFGAAMYAFQTTQRYGSADAMKAMLAESLGVDRVAVEGGGVPSYYVM